MGSCEHIPMTVTPYLGVSNFQRAISMVIPRSRSAFSLSRTQAYLKEPLPSSAASCHRSQLRFFGRNAEWGWAWARGPCSARPNDGQKFSRCFFFKILWRKPAGSSRSPMLIAPHTTRAPFEEIKQRGCGQETWTVRWKCAGESVERNIWEITNLLELLNGTLVDTTALVDQVTGLSRLLALVAYRSEPPLIALPNEGGMGGTM